MVQIRNFQTNDPDSFKENISSVAPVSSIAGMHRTSFHVKAKIARLPRIGLFSVELKNGRVLVDNPAGFFGLTVALNKPFLIAKQSSVQTISPGNAHCLHWSNSFDLRTTERTRMLVANLLPPSIHKYVEKLNGGEPIDAIPLHNQISLQTPAGSALWNLLNYLWREANNNKGLFSSELITKELEDALLASIVFVAEEQGSSFLQQQEYDCQSTYLRRAEEYIAAHLTHPVSLGDIALVAGVSIRTLTRAFRKRRGISPIALQKKLRVECANRELLAADPLCQTVTNIALKYGFHDLGRFSSYYQKTFGELPSESLRR